MNESRLMYCISELKRHSLQEVISWFAHYIRRSWWAHTKCHLIIFKYLYSSCHNILFAIEKFDLIHVVIEYIITSKLCRLELSWLVLIELERDLHIYKLNWDFLSHFKTEIHVECYNARQNEINPIIYLYITFLSEPDPPSPFCITSDRQICNSIIHHYYVPCTFCPDWAQQKSNNSYWLVILTYDFPDILINAWMCNDGVQLTVGTCRYM